MKSARFRRSRSRILDRKHAVTTSDTLPGMMPTGVSNAARTETLTVRKSWISDYKAGRLSLEEFKQKVLEY